MLLFQIFWSVDSLANWASSWGHGLNSVMVFKITKWRSPNSRNGKPSQNERCNAVLLHCKCLQGITGCLQVFPAISMEKGCKQRDRTRRTLLQYQNFYFLSYLGWSGSFPQSNNYIMKVVQYPSTEIIVAGFGVRTTVLWHENLEHYP